MPGAFFEPTVLVDVDQSMSCMREETFGPTLPLMKVKGAEEAIRLANDSSYGLSASVWTRDRAGGERTARRLEVGAVNVNDMFVNLSAIRLPQGGWKESGGRPGPVRARVLRRPAPRGDPPAPLGGHRADGFRLHVRKSKSAAGTSRRPPIAEPLREVLRRASLRNPSEPTDPVAQTSVMSGKIARRATAAWAAAGLNRITLHECRPTYASFLMAAGYTLKEIMEYMGHADVQMVQRYTKLLPQPEERDPADRLNAYLRRRRRQT